MSYKSALVSWSRVLPAFALLGLLPFTINAAQAEVLSFDSDHDVVVLPTCDLAVRFNNKTFVPVKATLQDTSAPAYLKIAPEKSLKITEDYASAKMGGGPEVVLIESYDVGKIGSFGSSRFNKDFVANNRIREVQFTNERIGKEIGLAGNSFIGITAVKAYEVSPKGGETPFYLYVMQSPEHLTTYSRKMRSGSRTFDLDPAVIVTQVSVRGTKDCVGNVKLEEPVAAAQTTPETKSATEVK